MADYRKRLVDMTDEERAQVAPGAAAFQDTYGDRTERPASVAVADEALQYTPAGVVYTAADIEAELAKDNPDWLKVGAIAGTDIIGMLPGIGLGAEALIRRGARQAMRNADEVVDVATEVAENVAEDVAPVVSRKSDEVVDVATETTDDGAPLVTRNAELSAQDYKILEADNVIYSWEKGEITNAELRSQMRELGFPIQTRRISPKAYGGMLEVEGPNGDIIPWEQIKLSVEEVGFAEGGVVLDPVSGNEVPPGSMPHEVRDDIDAKLSEGEYVVPADVVRYFGVKFFEDLRSKAKGELQEMHSGGRMGQPIDDDMPFSMEELHTFDDGEEEVPGFAEGGVVTQMELPDFLRGAGTGGAEEFRTYSNADGMLLTIRFVNGQPMSPIPPGYAPYDPTKEPTQDNLVTATESRSDGPDTQVGRSAQEEVDGAAKGLSNLSGEQMKDLTDFMTGKGGRIATGLASMTSFGALAGLGNRAITSAVAREAQTRFQNATTEEEKQQYFDIFTDATTRGKDVGDGIFGGGGIMGGGGTLNDNDNDGKRDLGDTWLGDLLGLDGKAGVQGANLSDSFNGARRTGGTGTQSKSLDNSRDTSSGAADDQGGGFWQGVKDFFSGNKDD